MTAHALLQSLLQYKADADDELLTALNAMVIDASSRDYASALRVIHHAHIVDCIFAANLHRLPRAYRENWGRETPPLSDLTWRIRDVDRWYLGYMAQLSGDELEESVDFIFTDGEPGRMSREEILAHVVTHGGYHRGEVGRLLPEIESTAMRDVFAGYLHRADPGRRARQIDHLDVG